ncbi:DUF3160 domain-containing protein [Candidatus Falkowbacteria bacterium]|nr:DUF3160 domain-containing protein [Candidatus Falkowbacteria bacterium]
MLNEKKYFGVLFFIFILLGIGFYLHLFTKPKKAPAPDEISLSPSPASFVGLPTSQTIEAINQIRQKQQELTKEKQFISSFWEKITTTYSGQAPNYSLPIPQIKETIVNYRDFSRKIDIDGITDQLSENGFAAVLNPFGNVANNWEDGYRLLKEEALPVLITADSVFGLYQDTLNIIYKEIEQEIFYPSLWQLLENLHDQALARYQAKFREFGIKTNLLTEASRLELAYLNVALQLLKPEPSQAKESIGEDKTYFSPSELQIYDINTPEFLTEELEQEVKLIATKAASVKSPIFLDQKDYQAYQIPPQYSTSEKLKNYYLAVTWLNQNLFPLWSRENDCPACLYDKADHQINFIAGLLLSTDLASDQNLKNSWADIYKSISFFKGLESGLTYLDYYRALAESFGDDYSLDEIFSADSPTISQRIALLQEKIGGFKFPESLSGKSQAKSEKGLRLLRDYHLLETKLFDSLTGENVGNYLAELNHDQTLPFTACQKNQTEIFRCAPTALDLLGLLDNQTAAAVLNDTKNNAYQNYQKNLDKFIAELETFDQNTWHDNAYMTLLLAIQKLSQNNDPNRPAFMKTSSWDKKTLNTGLGAWLNFHREINVEKTDLQDNTALVNNFPYGYIEPQIEVYAELLSNVNMVINGFTSLRIISVQTKSYDRLANLKILLEEIIDITKKELSGQEFTPDDYSFINNFNRHIRSFNGDIVAAPAGISHKLTYDGGLGAKTDEYLNGLDYIIVAYPNNAGEIFLAIGPVFNYREENKAKRTISDWQKEFKLEL